MPLVGLVIPLPVEVSPIEMVFGMPDSAGTTSAGQLELDTVELEVTGTTSDLFEASALPESILGASRVADELPGHGSQAPAQRIPTMDGLTRDPGSEMLGLCPHGPETVVGSSPLLVTPEPELSSEAGEALQKRATSIVLAGGFMVLIADERPLAKIMLNELLLLAYDVVFAFAAPSPLPLWAKRAFKEKLLSKLLASAIGCGDISLERAESEGKKLIQQGKEAKAVLAAKEKALAKAVAKLQSAGVDFSSVETQGKQGISDFLRLPCKVPFLGLPCISKTGVTESNLLMPPPPPRPPLHPPHPLPVSRPPPLSVPEEDPAFAEMEDAKWTCFAAQQFERQGEELEALERQLTLREQMLATQDKQLFRRQQEAWVLYKEIHWMEEAYFKSSCKRLREDRNELKEELAQRERAYYPGEIYESERNAHLSTENARLRAELADTKTLLAAEVTAVDELLVFKASTSMEAQRRLMCPRVSQ